MDAIVNFFKPKSLEQLADEHFGDLLKDSEFKYEMYRVHTDDGYQLALFRLVEDPFRKYLREQKKKVEEEKKEKERIEKEIKQKKAASEGQKKEGEDTKSSPFPFSLKFKKSSKEEETKKVVKATAKLIENFVQGPHSPEYKPVSFDFSEKPGQGRVVLMQHGLIDSSDSWIINSDENSPALFLARMGYDVWLGNNRGNKYCKTHKRNELDEKFWDFSFQQMGRYDLPAIIAKILHETGKTRISYVGHSQGTSQMFAALSDPLTSKFMNDHLDIFIAFAPIVYLCNQTNPYLVNLCKTGFESVAKMLKVYEIFPGHDNDYSKMGRNFQSQLFKSFPSLSQQVYEMSDSNPLYDNHDLHHKFVLYHPAGSSLRCFEHFKQMIMQPKDKPKFMKFDYGKERNLIEYGCEEAPEYDFSLINIPVRGYVGNQDKLGDVKDCMTLRQVLKDVYNKDYEHYIFDECGHLTFMWGREVTNLFVQLLEDLDYAAENEKKGALRSPLALTASSRPDYSNIAIHNSLKPLISTESIINPPVQTPLPQPTPESSLQVSQAKSNK